MIHLQEAVIVEGKYDKIKLSSLIDALIIPTNGFGIFKDKDKMRLIRQLADKTGIVVLTDSDSAGFMIRAKLSSCIAPEKIKHVYIPDIYGKEKRKRESSKEGKLGVEGISSEILLKALSRAGVTNVAEDKPVRTPITKIDMFNFGFSGGMNSSLKRKALLQYLGLPEKTPPASLLKILNSIMGQEEFLQMIEQINSSEKGEL